MKTHQLAARSCACKDKERPPRIGVHIGWVTASALQLLAKTSADLSAGGRFRILDDKGRRNLS